jgi:hypothetical protein
METIEVNKLKENLKRFTGSTQVFQYTLGDYAILFTEGVKYVADEGHGWWLVDLILSYQFQPLIYREKFQRWVLKKYSDDTWTINCTDGNGKVLASQHIQYSDFPLPEFTLWVVNETILLPSEY